MKFSLARGLLAVPWLIGAWPVLAAPPPPLHAQAASFLEEPPVTGTEAREPVIRGWRFSPTLGVRETFLDNVRLVARDEQSDFISEVAPGFRLTGGSRQWRADVVYELQNLAYLHDSSFNDSYHDLDARSSLALLDQRLNLDAFANYSQANISLDGPLTADNLAVTGNRTDTRAYGLTPSWRQALGNLALWQLQYALTRVDTDAVSTMRQYQSSLSSLPGAGPLGWSMLFSDEETDNQVVDDETQKRLNLDLSYRLSSWYSLVGSVGREEIRFSDAPGVGEINGPTWTFGGLWHPSARTEFDARVGEKAFGSSYSLSGRHSQRRWLFSTEYSEEVSSNNRQLLSNLGAGAGSGEVVVDSPFETAQGNIFVQERLALGAVFSGVRTSYALRLFDDSRLSQTGFGNQDLQEIEITMTRQLSRKNSLELSTRWSTRDNTSGLVSRTTRDLILNGLFVHQLGKQTSFTARLGRVGRTANDPALEYDALTLGIGIEMTL